MPLQSQLGTVVVIVCATLMIIGAVIDGWKLKVPNWLTFPMILAAWAFWFVYGLVTHGISLGGISPLGLSLGGALAAGFPLLVFYLIGGMGAGDVKLYAGFGAWMVPLSGFGFEHLFIAMAISMVLGAVMAVLMIWWKGTAYISYMNYREIITDLKSESLGEIQRKAKERKPTLQLLPYGVPLTIGSLAYIGSMYFLVVPLALGTNF